MRRPKVTATSPIARRSPGSSNASSSVQNRSKSTCEKLPRIALAVELGSIDLHNMHHSSTAVAGELSSLRCVSLVLWEHVDQFANDMPSRGAGSWRSRKHRPTAIGLACGRADRRLRPRPAGRRCPKLRRRAPFRRRCGPPQDHGAPVTRVAAQTGVRVSYVKWALAQASSNQSSSRSVHTTQNNDLPPRGGQQASCQTTFSTASTRSGHCRPPAAVWLFRSDRLRSHMLRSGRHSRGLQFRGFVAAQAVEERVKND